MGNLAIKTEHFGGTDQRYIVKPSQFTEVGCTLDLALFDAEQLAEFEEDFHCNIPGGLALGRASATQRYGPYTPGANEVQTLTRTATGGTITLTFDGETTGDITSSAVAFTAAAVQAALLALSNLAPGDVTVTGADGGPLTITFGGNYVGRDVPQVVVDNTDATGGTVVAATSTAGDGITNGLDRGDGVLQDWIPFPRGARTGVLAASRIVVGALYELKLPLASADAGTPGKVDAAFKLHIPTLAFVTL